MTNKPNFYPQSTNYKRLFELLNKGFLVVCFMKDENRFQYICDLHLNKNSILFIVDGYKVEICEIKLNSFSRLCRELSITFIDIDIDLNQFNDIESGKPL